MLPNYFPGVGGKKSFKIISPPPPQRFMVACSPHHQEKIEIRLKMRGVFIFVGLSVSPLTVYAATSY